jgi:ribosomal protein S18 acetylase RimI-like enzyme
MSVAYRTNSTIDVTKLQKLYKQASWSSERSLDGIAQMLQYTPVHVSAWQEESLVGFARAITDTQYRGLIDDVIVDEEYRERGIGTELMRRITAELSHLDEVYLFCDENKVGFYERHGYERGFCATLARVKKKTH